jgi:hypothetical protein
LQSRPGELEKILKRCRSLSRALLIDRASPIMKNLLHPKACDRAVQEAEQREMVFFARPCGELDYRGVPIEDLGAAVEHEVVVSCDAGEGDRERPKISILKEHRIFKPGETPFGLAFTVSNPSS